MVSSQLRVKIFSGLVEQSGVGVDGFHVNRAAAVAVLPLGHHLVVLVIVVGHFFSVTQLPVFVDEVVTGEFRAASFTGVVLHVHIQKLHFALVLLGGGVLHVQRHRVQVPPGVLLVAILRFKRMITIHTSKHFAAILVLVAHLLDIFRHHLIHHRVLVHFLHLIDFVLLLLHTVVFVDDSVETHRSVAASYVHDDFLAVPAPFLLLLRLRRFFHQPALRLLLRRRRPNGLLVVVHRLERRGFRLVQVREDRREDLLSRRGRFAARHGLNNRGAGLERQLALQQERATDLEGSRHVQDVRGEQDVVDVGEVEVEVASVHEREEGREFVHVDVGDGDGGGVWKKNDVVSI